MIRLTPYGHTLHVAVDESSLIVIENAMGRVFCVSCGGLKNGFVLFVPGQTSQEYDIKRALIDKERRCLCRRREVAK